MPIIPEIQGAQRGAKVRKRADGALRRAAVVAGAVGLTAGTGLLPAGSALASSGSQPGNLILHPASGASSLRPTFSTTDGCPPGHQRSAQIVEFNPNGTFGSRISIVVPSPTIKFSGTFAGDMAQLLALGTNTKPGQTSEWAMGCYSQIAGTGSVKYVQSTFVTLSSDGKLYSTSPGHGQSGSASGQTSGSTSGQSQTGQSASATSASGMSTQLEAGLIAGGCGLAVAVGGLALYRRRKRSRLQ
jgi:hypothetical protein